MPVLFHSRETVEARTSTTYIEDLSHKSDPQLQTNTSCDSELSGNKKPLFVVMNMLGLKKLVSKTEISIEQKKDTVKVADVEDSKSGKVNSSEELSDTEEASEITQMEDLLALLQDKKNLGKFKRRNKSMFTVTDGSSSTDSGTKSKDKVNSVSESDELPVNPEEKKQK